MSCCNFHSVGTGSGRVWLAVLLNLQRRDPLLSHFKVTQWSAPILYAFIVVFILFYFAEEVQDHQRLMY